MVKQIREVVFIGDLFGILQIPMTGGPYPAVIVCTSYAANINMARYEKLADELLEKGFAVLRIDLRGHGQSKGLPQEKITLQSEMEDLEDAIDYLLTRSEIIDTERIGIIGHSLGARSALLLAGKDAEKKKQIKALVAWAPSAYIEDSLPRYRGVNKYRPEWMASPELERNLLDSDEYFFDEVEKIICPTRIIFGENDEYMEEYEEKDLDAAMINNKSDLITLDNADHVFSGSSKIETRKIRGQLFDATVEWFEEFLKK